MRRSRGARPPRRSHPTRRPSSATRSRSSRSKKGFFGANRRRCSLHRPQTNGLTTSRRAAPKPFSSLTGPADNKGSPIGCHRDSLEAEENGWSTRSSKMGLAVRGAPAGRSGTRKRPRTESGALRMGVFRKSQITRLPKSKSPPRNRSWTGHCWREICPDWR